MRRSTLLLGLALLVLPTLAPAEPLRWTMPTEYPASSMPGEGVAAFAEALATASEGRLAIVPSFDAGLGIMSSEMAAALQEGRIQAADAFAGALGPVDKLFLLSSLPFVTTTLDEAERLYALARPAYEHALARKGLHLLYATPWPASGIWSRAPIALPADLQALRIRTYDSTGTAVFRAAGAAPVELSFAAATPRLKEGSLDAVLSSGDGGAGRRLWEVLPHFTEIGYAMPLSFALVSARALAALPDADRQVSEAHDHFLHPVNDGVPRHSFAKRRKRR